MTNVYLNGDYLPLEEARVSVLDRGFLFGDAVYEVIPVYSGVPFRFTQHIERLNNSLEAIHIQSPLKVDEWLYIAEQLIQQSSATDQALYIQVTRGVDSRRDHAYPDSLQPTIFMMCWPISEPDSSIKSGISAITLDDVRWKLCNIKATTLLANILAKHQASEKNAVEAIFIRDGNAVEGSASNLFIVRDNLIITPPVSDSLLPGITRDLVLELAQENSLPHREADISFDSLNSADEIWITSSTKEVAPVVTLNDKPVGNGTPGSVWKKMDACYTAYKNSLRNRVQP